MVLGFFAFVPVIEFLLGILSTAVDFLINKGLLPLIAVFVQPAKVLFLNNAVNHGIMIPLGVEQAAEAGKSLLFMIEANNGCVLGIALAFTFFGKGTAKKAAPGAAFINFFGGIGEVVYPFVLSKPLVILGQIAGSMVSLFIIQVFGGGTVAPISPGSFFALLSVSPKDAMLVNIISYFAGMAVSMLVAGFILKMDKTEDEAVLIEQDYGFDMPGAGAVVVDPKQNSAAVQRIIYACDAGMGSSVMGESIMKTKLQKAMLNIEVMHSSVATLCENARAGDLIVTTQPLEARVKNVLETNGKKNSVYAVDNLLNSEAYDRLVDSLKKSE